MLKKRTVSLIMGIMLITLLLFGCVEVDKSSTIDDEGLSSKIVEEVANGVSDEVALEEGSLPKNLDRNLKIHFIDVGQGSSVFIIGADGKTMLYDAGGEDESSGRIIVDYIQSIGYEHIDVAVFTHPHSDHINGAATVLKELRVDSIYYPKATHTTRTFEKFMEAVSNTGLKLKTAKAGVEVPFGETEALLVAPISNEYENLNDYSATLKLTWKGKSILLTGDVEKTSEGEMIHSSQDLDIDLLLVPHHGSNSSSTDEFLDKTTPSHAVISSGKDNAYGHPHKEVMDRLNARNIQTYNTAEEGTVIATFDGETIHMNAVGKKALSYESNKKVESNQKGMNHTGTSKNQNTNGDENNIIEKLDMEVSIDNTRPKQNSDILLTTEVTANGKPVEGAKVQIVNHYKSTTTPYEGVTDKDGILKISYGIGRASVGFEVEVHITVIKDHIEAKAQTSFIPQ